MRTVRLYFKYIRMHLLASLEYKGWWLLLLQTLAVSVVEVLPTFFMFERMGNIAEWTMERILLIYSIAVTSFGIAETICDGFAALPWNLIRTGEFDRLLLRPKSLFVQVSGSVFELYRISRAVVGICIMVWTFTRLSIAATFSNIMILLLAVVGGVLMYCGILIMTSGIAFFTIKALDWIYIFTYASYEVTRIPISYMPRWMFLTFTFAVPLLVISYFPVAAVGGWGGVSIGLGLLALPAGLVFLLISMAIWKLGLRHYNSTGS